VRRATPRMPVCTSIAITCENWPEAWADRAAPAPCKHICPRTVGSPAWLPRGCRRPPPESFPDLLDQEVVRHLAISARPAESHPSASSANTLPHFLAPVSFSVSTGTTSPDYCMVPAASRDPMSAGVGAARPQESLQQGMNLWSWSAMDGCTCENTDFLVDDFRQVHWELAAVVKHGKSLEYLDKAYALRNV